VATEITIIVVIMKQTSIQLAETEAEVIIVVESLQSASEFKKT